MELLNAFSETEQAEHTDSLGAALNSPLVTRQERTAHGEGGDFQKGL